MAQSRVQSILAEQSCLVFPGVYDCLSAKIVEDLGFQLTFISGYSVSAAAIGEPDLGLLTQTEMLERARRICGSVRIPIIVDADTGYGNPLNVRRTVQDLIGAGAAGCFLEDQVWPKKCGHMHGKKVVDRQEYLDKIRAAVEAKADSDFFIVARTDALAVVGLDEAIMRMVEARALGADATFVEAPPGMADLEAIGRRVPKPTVANMIEKGKTPVLAKAQLAQLGFQLILYPLSGLFAAAHALRYIYRYVAEHQTSLGAEEQLMSFDEFNQLIGVEEKYAWAERFGAI